MVIFDMKTGDVERVCSVYRNLRNPKLKYVREYESLALLGSMAQGRHVLFQDKLLTVHRSNYNLPFLDNVTQQHLTENSLGLVISPKFNDELKKGFVETVVTTNDKGVLF